MFAQLFTKYIASDRRVFKIFLSSSTKCLRCWNLMLMVVPLHVLYITNISFTRWWVLAIKHHEHFKGLEKHFIRIIFVGWITYCGVWRTWELFNTMNRLIALLSVVKAFTVLCCNATLGTILSFSFFFTNITALQRWYRCVQGMNRCLFKGAVQHLSSILCKSCVFCVHSILQQHFKGHEAQALKHVLTNFAWISGISCNSSVAVNNVGINILLC